LKNLDYRGIIAVVYVQKYKGFVTLAKNKNPAMIGTHCFIHLEVLVARTLEKNVKI